MESNQSSPTTSGRRTRSSAVKRRVSPYGWFRGTARPTGRHNSWRAGTLGIVAGLLLSQPLDQHTLRAALSILAGCGTVSASPSQMSPTNTGSSLQPSSNPSASDGADVSAAPISPISN